MTPALDIFHFNKNQPHLSSIIVQTIFLSVRGPSNSQRKTFCQVDKPTFPSISGIVSEGPTNPDFK
jgi:hypothetical protein